jgi:hypothetical protein
MTLRMKLGMVLAVLVMVGASAPSAEAWYGDGSFWCGAYPGYWLPPSLSQERPPYFAFYPPVYYGHPVYARFGVSPYPRGAQVAAAERTVVVPLTIKNEHVQPEVLAAGADRPTPGPLRIANPFVSPQGDSPPAESQVHSTAQVVHPVALARTGQ